MLVGGVALLLAAALGPAAPPPVDFGAVELGRAGVRMIAFAATAARATGAGFSATREGGRVLVVFEPYERDEARGTLRLRTRGRVLRVPLRGRGIDTIPPRVTAAVVARGRVVTVRFAVTDNDLPAFCLLAAAGDAIGRVRWPATVFRWRVPAPTRGAVRITVTAIDRAGNRASTTTAAVRVG